MVLYGKTGETIEKSIRVINNNSFDVTINLSASGDLGKNIIIEDGNFILSPQEERNVPFKIKFAKEGKTDSSIVVRFTPSDIANGKNGVALPVSIIVFAEKGNGTVINDSDGNNDDDGNNNQDEKNKISFVTISIIITGAIFFVFFILLIIYFKYSKKDFLKKEDDKGGLREEIKPKKRVKGP